MAAAVLPSIGSPSTSSSSSSTSIYHSKTAALLHCPSSFFTVRPYGRLKGSIFNSPHTLPRSFKILCAATKPAKSPAEEEWKIKRELLLQKKVRSVEVKEALRLQKENNFVILDVRPEAEFKEAHVPGAINVQIYRLIKEWTAWDIARPMESKLGKDSKIIVACSAGGTMKPSQNLPEGQQSRSLIAAYLLVLNGYKNVFHLEGGLYTWFKEGLPAVAEE
ncbi:Rhodanese-like domain-containing protein 14, chloroplastic [Linum perenne]